MADARDVAKHVVRQIDLGRATVRVDDVECPCPYCGKTGCFAINGLTGVYGGFKCGCRGKVTRGVCRSVRGWSRVRDLVRGREGVRLASSDPGAMSMPPLYAVAGEATPVAGQGPPPSQALIDEAYRYCLRRGMSPVMVRRYRVSAAACDRRAYFPYWVDEQITFWMGRALDPDEPIKTREPGTPKPLYGLHVVGDSFRGGLLVLVEGVFDHFATPRSLAVMGSTLSAKQLATVLRLRPSAVGVVFDPDALNKAKEVATMVSRSGVPAFAVRLGEMKDPADLGSEVMGRAVRGMERWVAVSRPTRPVTLVVPTSWPD